MLKKFNQWESKTVVENEEYHGPTSSKSVYTAMNYKEEEEKYVEKDEKGGLSLNPITCMRTLVSKKKTRLKVNGFDLDMTYITNYEVVMGLPADGA